MGVSDLNKGIKSLAYQDIKVTFDILETVAIGVISVTRSL